MGSMHNGLKDERDKGEEGKAVESHFFAKSQ